MTKHKLAKEQLVEDALKQARDIINSFSVPEIAGLNNLFGMIRWYILWYRATTGVPVEAYTNIINFIVALERIGTQIQDEQDKEMAKAYGIEVENE